MHMVSILVALGLCLFNYVWSIKWLANEVYFKADVVCDIKKISAYALRILFVLYMLYILLL